VSLFDPEMIILGGGVSQSFSLISEQLGKMIRKYAPRDCHVVQATLGEQAGVVGAAALFLKEYGLLLN
jgi:glucokinase